MEIIHVSAECYPVAKAGGLGDVVGALPKYQNLFGHDIDTYGILQNVAIRANTDNDGNFGGVASTPSSVVRNLGSSSVTASGPVVRNVAKVVMPMYRTKFLYENQWEVVHKGYTHLGGWWFNYTVIREKTNKLGFDCYLVDIYGLLDREKIYGYSDDTERFTAFQIAVVDWIAAWKHRPDVIHVHDHHTGLIPFMLKYCYAYRHLQDIPTVLTIHNAQYQGQMGWDKSHYLPAWDPWKGGMLEWKDSINPLASGIKCAWKVTTVSPSYLAEMRLQANGLEALLEYEKGKCSGILNGIDSKVWDPAADNYIDQHFSLSDADNGKQKNKQLLCERFKLDPKKPLITFIGRLVGEKGADLLPQAIEDSFYYIGRKMNFLILGSGFPDVEARLLAMSGLSRGDYSVFIGYDEGLSHLMYAGADFILMPSRVEPCGLNQLYAMRYGTIPIVRNTGGLKDTVIDYGEGNGLGGYGVKFNQATVGDITHGIWRSVELFQQTEKIKDIRRRIMQLDFSWESSVRDYLELYAALRN